MYFQSPWLYCQLDTSRSLPIAVQCCIPSTLHSPGDPDLGEAWALGAFAASWAIQMCNQNRELTDTARNSLA